MGFGFIVFCILCMVIFIYLPFIGMVYFFQGEAGLGVLCLLPLVCLIAGIIYYEFVFRPKREAEDKRQADLRNIYHYPKRLSKYEDGEMAGLNLLHIIKDAEKRSADPRGKVDLQHCERVVRKMNDRKSFDDLYRALRLTGCHLDIKDAYGRTIYRFA